MGITKGECVTIYVPRTRSGKIVRRLLKARALGLSRGDVSTLEEPMRRAPAVRQP